MSLHSWPFSTFRVFWRLALLTPQTLALAHHSARMTDNLGTRGTQVVRVYGERQRRPLRVRRRARPLRGPR